ncbi:MAG: hypothetical protein CMP51_05480 [Flavobacteriales bacterium]|nr:hypothetical protein [Flavobacteriales bacterium]
MKRIFFIIVFIPMVIFAQQLPHYSLYMLNDAVINPALISSKPQNQVALMVRDQWTGFEGAPKTQLLSYYGNNHLYGTGVTIVNDNTGPISLLSATISGSYITKSLGNHNMSLGLSANLFQYQMNNSDIILEDDGVIDPAMQSGVSDKVLGNSFSIGGNYFSNKFNVGFSVINIFNSNLNISNTGINNSLVNHYYIHGKYRYSISKEFKYYPSILFKKIGATNIQFDINSIIGYKDLIWGGISFRTGDAIVTTLGLSFNNYKFGYSYDITTSKMRIPSYGSHGFLLTYNFNRIEKDTDKDGVLDKDDRCPKKPGLFALKGCPDKDNDGVPDIDDNCIEEAGLVQNNGCPDRDSDGIIDKMDICPDVPGLLIFKGCPDTDKDGLQDLLDDCPEMPGPILNNGCPEYDSLYTSKTDTVFIFGYDTIYNSKVTWNNINLWASMVHFDHNSFELNENAKIILNKIAEFLNHQDNALSKMQINGHTSEISTKKYNLQLSIDRANVVMNYLIYKDVNPDRISTKGFGETRLISDSHAINRRVEFQLVK